MRSFAAGAAVFLAALPAYADTGNGPGMFEITPYGAYSFGGTFTDEATETEVKLEDSPNFGLILNLRQTANTQWEVIYSQQNADATLDASPLPGVTMRYFQGGGTYQGEGDTARPFLSATVGGTHISVDSDGYGSDTFFSFSIGGGLQIAASNRLGLRLEARAFGTLLRSGSSIFCLSDPAGGQAGCAITVSGDVLWQLQTMAGVVFRF